MDEKHCKKLFEFGKRSGLTELTDLPLTSLRRAVEIAEQFADGSVRKQEMEPVSNAALVFSRAAGDYASCYDEGWGRFDSDLMASGVAAYAAYCVSMSTVDPDEVARETGRAIAYLRSQKFGEIDQDGHPDERCAHCELLRDIFGNPFRPATTKRPWRTSTVLGLAEGIYEDRAFDRMSVLADAMEEVGCDNADILSHCRGDGPHVRGCWVIDLILGKN